jgi:methanogenic corrinoid protein MtbC1
MSRLYLDALRAGDAAGAYQVASRALGNGMTLAALYRGVITPAMYEIGRLWEEGVLTVADEHLASALTHRVLGALHPPDLAAGGIHRESTRPRAVLAAVEGELHALGLRMAADLLEAAGYETLYLGSDVPTEALLRALETLAPELLGLTATMPEAAVRLEDVTASARSAHPRLDIVVGGQAIASPDPGEATPVADLALIGGQVRR